jgi:S1-C subfamily serine protease
VIGVNVAGSSQAENIGFAITINAAKSLIQQAIEG